MTGSLAAFDFDGTITRRDTLVPFLARVAGPTRFGRACARLGLLGARGRISARDRDLAKEHLIELLLGGMAEHDLRTQGERYARDLLTGDRLRPEVVARVHEHHRAGHRSVLVSASLVYYLEPIARELSIDDVIGVEPEVASGVLTGRLARPNVRAEQKAVRLREWLGVAEGEHIEDVTVHAYGNSSGDHELLELADRAWWLGRESKCPDFARPFRPGTTLS
ncbi:MAG: HAD-IB family hydrolase [Microthrixaceae bacterium]|nr:HAD-IB family hydrolase [Microthrixaceae bacterium]